MWHEKKQLRVKLTLVKQTKEIETGTRAFTHEPHVAAKVVFFQTFQLHRASLDGFD